MVLLDGVEFLHWKTDMFGMSEVKMSHWLAVTEESMFYSPTFVGNDATVEWVLIDFFGK